MIKQRWFNKALMLKILMFASITILTSGCSFEREKPREPITIQELLIEPGHETIEEAKARLEAINNYPSLSKPDMDLYMAISKAKDELEHKIKIMQWQEDTGRRTIQELLIEPGHETIEEAKERLEAINNYPSLSKPDMDLYMVISKAKDELEHKIKIMQWQEDNRR